MTIVATASEAGEAVHLAQRENPDLILMDIEMPGLICFDAARRLAPLRPDIKILMVSAFVHDRYIEEALSVGARGYVIKDEPFEVLLKAIRKVANGEVFFSERIWSRLVITPKGVRLAGGAVSRLSTLSVRELEILRYLAQGMTKKEVGATVSISEKTVEVHTGSIMKKLDIHDRVELARFAIREGLVRP